MKTAEVIETLRERAERDHYDWAAYLNPQNPVKHEYSVAPLHWGRPGRRFDLALSVAPDGTVTKGSVSEVKAEKQTPEASNVEPPQNQIEGLEFSIGQKVLVRFPDGLESEDVITEITKRQVTVMAGFKFKRSDGTGWAGNDAHIVTGLTASGSVETKLAEPVAIEGAMKGDELVLSTGNTVKVTKATDRQVRAGGYKFKYSGEGWGGQKIYVQAIA